jgi:hypothetical protein
LEDKNFINLDSSKIKKSTHSRKTSSNIQNQNDNIFDQSSKKSHGITESENSQQNEVGLSQQNVCEMSLVLNQNVTFQEEPDSSDIVSSIIRTPSEINRNIYISQGNSMFKP